MEHNFFRGKEKASVLYDPGSGNQETNLSNCLFKWEENKSISGRKN